MTKKQDVTDVEYESVMQDVLLSEIHVSDSNKQFRRALTPDFVASIKTQGILQPLRLRPRESLGKGSGYEIVCGERRYLAAKELKLASVPAIIDLMTDEQALDAQISENINREDITPFQEAKVYRVMYDRMKAIHDEGTTIEDLSARLGKSPSYIAQRMQLNNLIPEIAKLLDQEQIQLGHAMIACRLSVGDQKECEELLSDKYEIQTVKDFQEYVDREFLHKLSSAPWKKDDADLVPKAGSCNACPKRTGANPMLFGDANKHDNCLDGKCFSGKLAAFVISKVKDLIENKPDVAFIRGYNDPDPAVVKFITDQGIKILKEHNDFNDYSHTKKEPQIKGFWLSGDKMGKTVTVWARSDRAEAKAAGNKKGGDVNLNTAIAGIRARTKRAAELDEEKIYIRILEAMQKSKKMKEDTVKEITLDKAIVRWIVMQHAGHDRHYLSGFKMKGTPKDQILKLGGMPDKKFYQIARNILLKEYAGQAPVVRDTEGQLLWQLAEAIGVPVTDYVKEQALIHAKRLTRAEQRIEKLKRDAAAGIKPKVKNKPAAKADDDEDDGDSDKD